MLRRLAVPDGLQAVLALLGRMMFFIKRYLAFMFLEVIDPQWHAMMQQVQSASSLDEVRLRNTFWLHNKGHTDLLAALCCCAVLALVGHMIFSVKCLRVTSRLCSWR